MHPSTQESKITPLLFTNAPSLTKYLRSHTPIPIQLPHTNFRTILLPQSMFPPHAPSPGAPIHKTRSLRFRAPHCLPRRIFRDFTFFRRRRITPAISIACGTMGRICIGCGIIFAVYVDCVGDECTATVSTVDVSFFEAVEL